MRQLEDTAIGEAAAAGGAGAVNGARAANDTDSFGAALAVELALLESLEREGH